jgi:hypothetical protein
MTWMERLNRMFAIDLSICPDCGGRLRVIADVTRSDIIQKIVEHVARQRAPPEFSAKSSMPTIHSIAARQRLRGADAVSVAVAAQRSLNLITRISFGYTTNWMQSGGAGGDLRS